MNPYRRAYKKNWWTSPADEASRCVGCQGGRGLRQARIRTKPPTRQSPHLAPSRTTASASFDSQPSRTGQGNSAGSCPCCGANSGRVCRPSVAQPNRRSSASAAPVLPASPAPCRCQSNQPPARRPPRTPRPYRQPPAPPKHWPARYPALAPTARLESL